MILDQKIYAFSLSNLLYFYLSSTGLGITRRLVSFYQLINLYLNICPSISPIYPPESQFWSFQCGIFGVFYAPWASWVPWATRACAFPQPELRPYASPQGLLTSRIATQASSQAEFRPRPPHKQNCALGLPNNKFFYFCWEYSLNMYHQ